MDNLTDKNFVAMLKGGYKCWLSKNQAELIKNALKKKAKFIEVDNIFLKAEDISFILPAVEIDREDRIKKGDWRCSFCGRWHAKDEECGCQGGRFK